MRCRYTPASETKKKQQLNKATIRGLLHSFRKYIRDAHLERYDRINTRKNEQWSNQKQMLL